MTEFQLMVRLVLPVLGALIGWLAKEKLSWFPNEFIPVSLIAAGAVVGYYVVPSVGVENAAAWTGGGSVALKEIVEFIQRRRGG